MWLHVDQRPMRARCEAILAHATTAADPEHQLQPVATERALLEVLAGARLVPGARSATTALLFTQVRDPTDRHRTIERAIPVRGALRRGRAVVAALGFAAASVGLAWLSPWLLLVPAMVLAAGSWYRLQRWLISGRGALHIHQMEQRATLAKAAGDAESLALLYEEARQMIAEDRVPPRVGFRLAHVLAAAADLTPFPVELVRELWRLLVIAPEADLTFDHARSEIERSFQHRAYQLASRIRHALPDATELGPLLDECSTLIERLAPRLLVELPVVLDEVATAATEPATIERARALHERLAERRREMAAKRRARST